MMQTAVMIAPNGASRELDELDARPALNAATALAGNSEPIRTVIRSIARLAHSPDVAALISGEAGVGKEIVARCIHRADPREGIRLVKVDGSALTGNDATTFAWLDAAEGAFRDAGGTLVIDHVEQLSGAAQVATLELVNRLRALASDRARAVRVLSISTVDIERAVGDGRFRADLFYRLATVTITIPPLRERKGDIPMLANQFLALINRELGKQIEGLDEEALQRMLDYPWPGNVRELRSVVERAAILTSARTLPAQHIMVNGSPHTAQDDEPMTLADMERRMILRMLERTGNNRSLTAKLLGINRGTLYNKLRQYRLSPDGTEQAAVLQECEACNEAL
jgi:two-component system response regulator HydG